MYFQNLNRRITMVKDELARNQDKTEKKRIGSKQRIRTLTESQVALNEQRRALELQAESKMRDVNEIEREVRFPFTARRRSWSDHDGKIDHGYPSRRSFRIREAQEWIEWYQRSTGYVSSSR